MRPTTRRLLSLVMVMALLGQFVAPVAASAASSPDCTPGDSSDWVKFRVYFFGDENPCQFTAEQLTNQSRSQAYSSALALEDERNASVTPLMNHLEDARTIAKMEAKATALQSLKNGSNVSVAMDNVNDSLAEYFTPMQANLIEANNVNINQMEYIIITGQQANYPEWAGQVTRVQDGGASTDRSIWKDSNGWTWYLNYSQPYTLLNGTNKTVNYVEVTDVNTDRGTFGAFIPVANRWTEQLTYERKVDGVWILHPNESISSSYGDKRRAEIYHTAEFDDANQRIIDEYNWAVENGTAYTQAIYNESGGNYSTLNITKIMDPFTLSRDWSTNQKTTGSYSWLAAEFGLSGINGTVNDSFSIQYTPASNETRYSSLDGNDTGTVVWQKGETYNLSGTMFTDWDPTPNSTPDFEVNGTYNTSNADAPVLFIAQKTNTSTVVELDGEFTVKSLTDVTSGQQINSTTLEEQNYQTWNASSTREEMLSLIRYQEQVLSNYDTGGGGSGGGWDINVSSGLAAGLGMLVLIIGGAAVLTNN